MVAISALWFDSVVVRISCPDGGFRKRRNARHRVEAELDEGRDERLVGAAAAAGSRAWSTGSGGGAYARVGSAGARRANASPAAAISARAGLSSAAVSSRTTSSSGLAGRRKASAKRSPLEGKWRYTLPVAT